jgi:hypothetical protein
MDMAPKQYMNHLILEIVQPLTTRLVSVWKARYEEYGVGTRQEHRWVLSLTFSVITAKLDGQIARDGYMRNLRVRPARPYPIKLVDRVRRT